MTIELLYVPDCPHVPAAMAQLRDVLSQEAVTAEIREIVVKDMAAAEALRFCGSPTIRVNGRDVLEEPRSAAVPSLTCRLYSATGKTGASQAEMIRGAVREAIQKERL